MGVEEFVDGEQLFARRVQRIHPMSERVGAGKAASVPADVLARSAHAREFAVETRSDLRDARSSAAGSRRYAAPAAYSPVCRKCSISRNSHGRPCAARPIMIASAPVAASTSRAFSRRGDVAVGDHRNAHGGFHRGDGLVFGVALVQIGARAAVHGQHRNAGVFGADARNVQRILVLAIPAGADLQRDGHRVRARRRLRPPPPRRCARPAASFCSSAEPAATLQTFLAGQPMLMSMICAPFATL